MNRKAIAAVLAGIVVLAGLLLVGPTPVRPAREHTGDPALADTLADNARSGQHNIAAFTYVDGKTTFAGLGADEHTEFEIGSITKTFTDELLHQQIEANALSLDTKVGDIIDTDGEIADVTLEELANHTSGLPRLANTNMFFSLWDSLTAANPYEGETSDDVIEAAKTAKLKDRGERVYSNFGLALLGQLLAIKTGKPYEELLRQGILEPAHMDETYLALPGTVPDDAPRGLATGGRTAEAWQMEGSAPAGALRSTASDMAKYAQFIRDRGTFDYGWSRQESTGFHWHNGGTGGFSSMLAIDPVSGETTFAVTDSTVGTEKLAMKLVGKDS